MYSTREVSRLLCWLVVGAVAWAVLLSAGCRRVRTSPEPDALNDTPLIVDEAMQIRDWDRSTAYYPSGAVVAGSPRRTFEPRDDTRLSYAADPLIGLANFVIIPFTYFSTPPFTKVPSRGAIVPPTHTAVPEVRVIE